MTDEDGYRTRIAAASNDPNVQTKTRSCLKCLGPTTQAKRNGSWECLKCGHTERVT